MTSPPACCTVRATIDRPRPEPGRERARRGAPEAVEDVREFLGGDAGAVVTDRQDSPSAERHLDRAARAG